jgi:glycerol kinase
MCDEIRERGLEPWVRDKTGLVVDAYFSATKLRWVLDNVPGLRERSELGELAFGTVDSWLAYRLSGGRSHVTDASNASRTMLYNLKERRWDPELLREFAVPEAVLPQVVPSSGVVATIDNSWLGADLPIAGIAGDQQAALWPDLLSAGDGQEHLRHRLLRPPPYGQRSRTRRRLAGDRRLPDR